MRIQNFKSKLKSRKTFAFLLIILPFAFCLLNLSASKASAEGISLKIQPSSLQIRSMPPADIRAPFVITNHSNESVELTAIVKSFESSNMEDGHLSLAKLGLTDERIKDSFLENVQITDNGFVANSFTLSPKQEKRLELTINVPKNSAPQDHYFSVIFLTKATENPVKTEGTEKEATSYVQMGINLPVILAIDTNKTEATFVEEFSAPIFLQAGPVPFTVKLKNAGTHFISPKGVILVKNIFGQIVGRVDIPTTNILAGSSRYLTSENSSKIGDKLLAPRSLGEVGSTQKIVWPENFLLGFYTATLTLVSHDNQLLYTRSLHFLAFPFTLLFSLIIISGLLFVIIKRLRKKISEG